MKFTKILIVALLSASFVACDYESFEEESALGNLQFGNTFVRLLTGGIDGTTDVEVSETNTSATVGVESRDESGSEVSVEYSLGGTAAYGTIYTIDGATQSGGTLTIPFQESADNTGPAQADIDITFLVDTLTTAPLTIELGLVSASANGAAVDVGQGVLRKDLIITLIND
jgi:hypothetical protein